MSSKWICFVVCVLFNICDSAFVETLQKCSYKDGKCVADLAQNVLKDISVNGIPELNIPPIDPLNLNDVLIPMLGLFNISLSNAQIKGAKDCQIDSIVNDLKKGTTDLDITCDIDIKGKFLLDDVTPLVQGLFGANPFHADGNIKTKVEKLHMRMKFFYDVIRKEDGEIYIKCHLDDFSYNFDVGNMKVLATKIFFQKQDISDFVVAFVNHNWKFIIPTFGKAVFDVAMDIFKNLMNRFFEPVPAKYFLSDDLSSFVKN